MWPDVMCCDVTWQEMMWCMQVCKYASMHACMHVWRYGYYILFICVHVSSCIFMYLKYIIVVIHKRILSLDTRTHIPLKQCVRFRAFHHTKWSLSCWSGRRANSGSIPNEQVSSWFMLEANGFHMISLWFQSETTANGWHMLEHVHTTMLLCFEVQQHCMKY